MERHSFSGIRCARWVLPSPELESFIDISKNIAKQEFEDAVWSERRPHFAEAHTLHSTLYGMEGPPTVQYNELLTKAIKRVTDSRVRGSSKTGRTPTNRRLEPRRPNELLGLIDELQQIEQEHVRGNIGSLIVEINQIKAYQTADDEITIGMAIAPDSTMGTVVLAQEKHIRKALRNIPAFQKAIKMSSQATPADPLLIRLARIPVEGGLHTSRYARHLSGVATHSNLHFLFQTPEWDEHRAYRQ